MFFNVNGVHVNFNWINDATEEEAKNYVDYVAQRVNYPVKSVTVTQCDDGLDLDALDVVDLFNLLKQSKWIGADNQQVKNSSYPLLKDEKVTCTPN